MSAPFFTGRGGAAPPAGSQQLEALEDDVAARVETGTRRVTTVPRTAPPSLARAGDVAVDGCESPRLTEELRAHVEALIASFPASAPGGFDL